MAEKARFIGITYGPHGGILIWVNRLCANGGYTTGIYDPTRDDLSALDWIRVVQHIKRGNKDEREQIDEATPCVAGVAQGT